MATKITESIAIGYIAGNVAHAWIEAEGDMQRFFKEVPASVFCESLGRDIGLTNVVEITIKEYSTLFSIFAAA